MANGLPATPAVPSTQAGSGAAANARQAAQHQAFRDRLAQVAALRDTHRQPPTAIGAPPPTDFNQWWANRGVSAPRVAQVNPDSGGTYVETLAPGYGGLTYGQAVERAKGQGLKQHHYDWWQQFFREGGNPDDRLPDSPFNYGDLRKSFAPQSVDAWRGLGEHIWTQQPVGSEMGIPLQAGYAVPSGVRRRLEERFEGPGSPPRDQTPPVDAPQLDPNITAPEEYNPIWGRANFPETMTAREAVAWAADQGRISDEDVAQWEKFWDRTGRTGEGTQWTTNADLGAQTYGFRQRNPGDVASQARFRRLLDELYTRI